MALYTLKNFYSDEIDSKMWVIQDFNNSPETLAKYMKLFKNKGNLDFITDKKEAKELEKFFSKYEILEEPKFDKKSGMSALVIGNKDTKKVEIIFGASQGLRNIFLIGGEKGKRARQDWIQNDLPSTIFTPDTQRAAKKFTYQVMERYKNGYNGYKELTTVNVH